MKVAFFTTGRFHLLDLAVQFQARGHDVQFLSILPPWRLKARGLRTESGTWVGHAAVPPLLLDRMLPRHLRALRFRRLATSVADWTASVLVRNCDVAISMSGIGCNFLKAARDRFGALTVTERSSVHILRQREILSAIPSWDPNEISDSVVSREYRSYQSADVVSVPSTFVARSFTERGEFTDRLEVNPIGVDFSEFWPARKPMSAPMVINVGIWSLRKGCDVLASACKDLNIHLRHVGPIGDCATPTHSGFDHFDPVQQSKLAEHYAKAHVLALPSREDGFGMVLAQALACGLPIVCSDHTGGPDLKAMSTDAGAVSLCRPNDVESLKEAIMRAIQFSEQLPTKRKALIHPSALSWATYAANYEAMLLRRLGHERPKNQVEGLASK